MLHTLNFPLPHYYTPYFPSFCPRHREVEYWSTEYITPLLLMLQFFFANLTFLAKKIPQDTHYCNLASTQVDAMLELNVTNDVDWNCYNITSGSFSFFDTFPKTKKFSCFDILYHFHFVKEKKRNFNRFLLNRWGGYWIFSTWNCFTEIQKVGQKSFCY